jgi:hypothetical protein
MELKRIISDKDKEKEKKMIAPKGLFKLYY